MTAISRVKIALIAIIGAILITFGAGYFASIAHGQPADAGLGSEVATAPGSGSATSSPTTLPADKLHDPVAAPAQAWDELKAAKKTGWAVLVFAVLVMLTRLLARFGAKDSWLAALGKGKAAVVIGAVGALSLACYNALALGGAWIAAGAAGVIALAHYLDASKPADRVT